MVIEDFFSNWKSENKGGKGNNISVSGMVWPLAIILLVLFFYFK